MLVTRIAKPSGPQSFIASRNRFMTFHVHPLCRARRGLPRKCACRWLFDRVDRVGSQHANRITCAQNRADIVRIMDVFQHHRQVWLPPREHGSDARLPSLCPRPTLDLDRPGPGQRLPVGSIDAAHVAFVLRPRRCDCGLPPSRALDDGNPPEIARQILLARQPFLGVPTLRIVSISSPWASPLS